VPYSFARPFFLSNTDGGLSGNGPLCMLGGGDTASDDGRGVPSKFWDKIAAMKPNIASISILSPLSELGVGGVFRSERTLQYILVLSIV
jgi:hypothetical protein